MMFDQGMLCAGGNGKGSGHVRRKKTLKASIKLRRATAEEL